MSKFAGLMVQAEKPARLILLHPATGQPLRKAGAERDDPDGVSWIDLLSADSEAALRFQRDSRDRRLAGGARRMKAADLDAEGSELLAALTRGWNLLTLAGEPLAVPLTQANAVELYSMPELAWLREQVDRFASDRGNYLAT